MRKLKNEELHRISKDDFKAADKTPLILVLDNVRSHLNVGSVFRTADAFAVEAVYLCGITGIPPHRDIQKTALGATETVAWKYFETTQAALEELKQNGILIAAIEQAENATQLHEFEFPEGKKLALVFGNEVDGVEQSIVSASDYVIEIPQFGTKHSLNISVSAGVVVWDLVSKWRWG
jgi:tRNA G18 (ribose-2'-O)-methylase SpoU